MTTFARHQKIGLHRALTIATEFVAAHFVTLVQCRRQRTCILSQQFGLVSLGQLNRLVIDLGVNGLLVVRFAPAHLKQRLSGLLPELVEDLYYLALHAREPYPLLWFILHYLLVYLLELEVSPRSCAHHHSLGSL